MLRNGTSSEQGNTCPGGSVPLQRMPTGTSKLWPHKLPSTFSLRTLPVPLVPGLAVFFPPFLSAALVQLKVAGSALPGLEMARDGLGTCCHSSAPSRKQCLLRLIALSQGRALWGNSKSLPHCSFCLLFGEGMKASVVSWPIILITFGHEAWLE